MEPWAKQVVGLAMPLNVVPDGSASRLLRRRLAEGVVRTVSGLDVLLYSLVLFERRSTNTVASGSYTPVKPSSGEKF